MHEITISTPQGEVPAFLPRPTRELPDGRVGYFQRQLDDCQRAALATLFQIDYEDVPRLTGAPGTTADELASVARLCEWVHDQGYRVRFHRRPPEGTKDYMAVTIAGDDRYRHVVAVLAGHIFDPASGWMLPVGVELNHPDRIEYVVVFEKRS